MTSFKSIDICFRLANTTAGLVPLPYPFGSGIEEKIPVLPIRIQLPVQALMYMYLILPICRHRYIYFMHIYIVNTRQCLQVVVNGVKILVTMLGVTTSVSVMNGIEFKQFYNFDREDVTWSLLPGDTSKVRNLSVVCFTI